MVNFDKVARSLIWASLGLGLVELLAPKRVQRMIGVRRGDHTGLIRLLGARELSSALMIWMQSRPNRGVWTRLLGDAMDLGLLSAASNTPRVKKDQLSIATASIAGLTALDALTAMQLTRQRADARKYSVLTKEDLNSRARNGAFHVAKAITIQRTPEELYSFWRNFSNLPQFMYHLQSVRVYDERHSHWITMAPAGQRVEWDAEVTEDQPNRRIAWQSTTDADVPNSGAVTFEPAPAGRGTYVRVEIEYRPPGGAAGKVIAGLFGEEPSQQVAGDLTRFKQVMETGEVLRSDGSPRGFGQKLQRPARPISNKEVEKLSRKDPLWQKQGLKVKS